MIPDMNYYTRVEYNRMDYTICATFAEAENIQEHNRENNTINIKTQQ